MIIYFTLKRYRYLLVPIIVLGCFLKANCQSSISISDFKNVPIPPSPNASALGKFGDIPVSYSTGIPDISIPIYSYADKQKDLNLNISLMYHAGGHKVEDMASNVGLGWALNAGGVIMRTVKGIPDDASNGYLKTPALPLCNTDGVDIEEYGLITPSLYPSEARGICQYNSESFFIIKSIADNTWDGESDIFVLSVGSINEKFFFGKDGIPVFITPNTLHIEPVWSNYAYSTIEKFIVTDANGVSYIFDRREDTQTDDAFEPSVPAPPVYTSSWYLGKIKSADKIDSITFSYETTTVISYESGLTLSVKSKLSGNPAVDFTYSYHTTHTYNAHRISEINLPDGTQVVFSYMHNRQDYIGDLGLTSIQISGDQHSERFGLNYDYFVSPNCYLDGVPCSFPPSANGWQKRLKLLSVQKESGVISSPPYVFEYNSTPLPARNSKDQDWWGYYNGGLRGEQMENATLSSILGYDRIPSLSHCKAWSLEKITYPTGGNTQFTYGLNEGMTTTYYYSPAVPIFKQAGGLRIEKKEDYDPVTEATYTTKYTYTKEDSTTSGELITIPVYTAYRNHSIEIGNYGGARWISAKNVYWNESYAPTQTLSYFNGSPVIYTRIKEEQYVSGLSNGYKIFEFAAGTTGLMHDFTYPFVQKQDLDWMRGMPLKTSVFNSNNSLLSREENEYQISANSPPIADLNTRNLVAGVYRWDISSAFDQYVYGARYYNLIRGKSQLIKTTRKEYSGTSDSLQTITEYTYDPIHYLPTSTKITNSQGKTIETKNYYPFNYNPSTYPLMNSLVTEHRLAEVVSTEDWITEDGNSSVRSIVVNDYSIVNSNLLKKTKVSSLKTDKPIAQSTIGNFNPDILYRLSEIEEDVSIEKFDSRGRAVEFKFNGNGSQAMIWGDQNEYPIASATNAKYNDIAFTSFEEDSKGNWHYEGASTLDNDAPTGKRVYRVDNPILKDINIQKVYVVSFWRKGTIFVNGGALSKTGKTIHGWTYEEYKVSYQSSITITGNGYVDEVRLFPEHSQMKSYTFKHPIDVKTISDYNGNIIYYDYDELGRLLTIKDDEGNLLNAFKYNYKEN